MGMCSLGKKFSRLKEEYAKHGIDAYYVSSSRNVYLRIHAAPLMAPGRVFRPIGYTVTDLAGAGDIDARVSDVKRQYIDRWGGNPKLLSYAATVQ